MNRRKLLKSIALSGASLSFADFSIASSQSVPTKSFFSIDDNKIRFSHPKIQKQFSITFIADTHLFLNDSRGDEYNVYSKRMSKAYNQTKHFKTGKEINPNIAFEETLKIANETQSSLVALVGDIFSFPSEASIDWVLDKLKDSAIPYVYTAGNHDWHYEGMEGSSTSLRDTWINKRLLPLYQGRNPLMQKLELNGVQIIVLDNSTYEITDEQYEFFNSCISSKKLSILMLHIPLYVPGRSLAFGCGHPKWNAKNDKSYQLERREPWREDGHTPATMKFHELVFNAKNLMGVLAGHIHNSSIDIVNGVPQIVAEANAEGGFLQIDFIPINSFQVIP
jgi:UDP-2,3-diacylglucosamine pyrophosphatase LpxH